MKTMLKYQELDGEIARLNNELQANEGRKNAIKMQQALKDYQVKLLELNKKASNLTQEFEKYREIFNSMAENLEVVNKNLEQKDEKKLEGLIEANDAIANNLLKLEKKITTVLEECDKVQAEYQNIMKSARLAKTNLEKYKAEFSEVKTATEQKIAEIQAELQRLEKTADKTLLQKYKQKRAEKVNVFVLEINGKCGGCRMEISAEKKAKLKADGRIECENCGRIIYSK